MKKTFLFLAALAMSAMMMAAEKTLTFDLSSNPGSWPTANSTTLTDYTYTLEGVDYTFSLKNVKCNKGYTMFTATAVMGLPAIEGYKLTKVVAKNSGGCSTTTKVGISSSSESANYISGGDAQTWATQGSSYTYELDETSDNTVYYLYVTNKNAQVTELELTYTDGTSPTVTLDSLVIKGKAEKMEYEVGEAFDPAGLEVWGIYTKTVKHDSTSQITKGITWSIDPETFAEISDNASVTLSVSYKDQTTADTTITGINVIPAVKRIETTIAFSNTLFGVAVGNNEKEQSVTKDTVTIVSGCKSTASTKTSYQSNHVRYYTDSYLKLSVPNGLAITKVEFTASGTTWDNTGISVNVGTYTADSKTWTGKNRSIEFSFSKQCRVGSIKVTCVETAPAAATPTITPSTEAEIYWEPFTVTLACATEGAAIYYTTNGDVPTAASTLYEAPFQVSATTTVKAIAVKEGLDNSEVASKIFNFGKVYDNIAACFADTTLQNEDVVKISNVSAVITSFAKSGKTVYFEGGSFYVNATYPQTYAIGGTLSGSNLQFTYMNYDPQQLRPASWEALTYTAPGTPTNLQELMQDNIVRKVLVNGHLVIMKDNQLFNLQGQAL